MSEDRVPPMGRHVQQGHQHKGPTVQVGVRQDQPAALPPPARPVQPPAAVCEQIYVDRSCLHRQGSPSPGPTLNLLDKLQQFD
jgi:hypothetical protein